ncbi:hypothetical protein ZWY2020_048364 [Hordeum vulgare]|nr:hypothetical protein ZWY2020_048364 [Hordeum vulgare]
MIVCRRLRFRQRTTPEPKQRTNGDGGTHTWTHGLVPSKTVEWQATTPPVEGERRPEAPEPDASSDFSDGRLQAVTEKLCTIYYCSSADRSWRG